MALSKYPIQQDYIPLKVKLNTLKRLFAAELIHADELVCEDSKSKQALAAMLLELLTEIDWPPIHGQE